MKISLSGVFVQVRGRRAAEVFQGGVQGTQHGDHGQHGVTDGLSEGGVGVSGWCAAQSGEQHGGRAAAGVAVLDAERGHALFPEAGGGRGGGIAGEELQGDGRLDVGEHGLGAGPVRVQQCGELVGRGDAGAHEVIAGTYYGAQRLGLRRVGRGGAQLVLTQPQVLGDHRGVSRVALGAGEDFGLPPGLDGVGFHRHDGESGFQQRIDQTAVGAFDPDGDLDGSPNLLRRRIRSANPAAM